MLCTFSAKAIKIEIETVIARVYSYIESEAKKSFNILKQEPDITVTYLYLIFIFLLFFSIIQIILYSYTEHSGKR